MPTLIADWENTMDMVALDIKRRVDTTFSNLGERPFLQKRMSQKQELEAYQSLRTDKNGAIIPDGMYHYAEGIRKELEERLSGVSEDDRLAQNLGPEDVRRIAYLLTLKYADEMTKLSEKLGIPITGLEIVPPAEPQMIEGEQWQDSMTGLTDMSMNSSLSDEVLPVAPPGGLAVPPPTPDSTLLSPEPSSLAPVIIP